MSKTCVSIYKSHVFAINVMASTQQQQSRYRVMLILSKTCISLYMSHVFAIYVMTRIRQQ